MSERPQLPRFQHKKGWKKEKELRRKQAKQCRNCGKKRDLFLLRLDVVDQPGRPPLFPYPPMCEECAIPLLLKHTREEMEDPDPPVELLLENLELKEETASSSVPPEEATALPD